MYGMRLTVSVKNNVAINDVMQHLFALRHRRIGFITGMMFMAGARQRLQGYKEALAEAGLPFDPDLS